MHHVLWTGGWDSTFRVLDLVLTYGRTVQPWYVLEPKRSTTQRELDTMDRIRRGLAARDRRAAERVRPIEVRALADLPPDPAHASAVAVVGAREPLTSQQHFLPVLVRHEGLGAMETGITADDHMEDAFALCRVVRNRAPAPDDWWYLDPEASDPDSMSIWGGYRMPLLHLSKLQMAALAEQGRFRALMEQTWFCRHPTILGRPCGLCMPCAVTWEAGVRWRVPRLSATRIVLHTAKGDLIRRAAMARADLDSVVRADRARLTGRRMS